jgi:subtilisin-like proprotein convertase family protein
MGFRTFYKAFLPIFIFLLIASFVSPINAQSKSDHSEILLNSGSINTSSPEMQAVRNAVGSFEGKRLHLVQFAGPTTDELYEKLSKTGVRIVTYIPFYAYLVYGDEGAIARIQSLASSENDIQWDGAFLDQYKIHPLALPNPPKGIERLTDVYEIQLVEDDEVNNFTLAALGQWQLEPYQSITKELGYVNIKVRLVPESVFEIAKQPDVVSIQAAPEPTLNDERQDVIVSGNITGNNPTGPGYLSFLTSKGFTQGQFSSSGFGVDVSDDGVDNGTASPLNPALYELGNTSNPDRLVYVRREPAGAGEIRGCFGHGNLNTHIVAGYNALTGFPHEDGLGFNYNLGVCPFCRTGNSVIFTPGFTFPDYEDLQSRAYNDGMRLSTNSWGANVGGAYNSDSQRYDALVRDAQPAGSAIPAAGNQEMVILFSSGNQGPAANTVGSPGTAKNVITVGAAENVQAFGGSDGCGVADNRANSANDMANFSSRGPCDDGRIKPDIVAPGTHVTGGVFPIVSPPVNGQADACFDGSGVCGGVGIDFFPAGQQWTTASSGTSHSTPAVAGGAALLRQYFINNGINPPSPAMTKAYLTNSARYLTGAVAGDTLPSQGQGMGEMNLGFAFDGVSRILKDQIAGLEFSTTAQSRTFIGTVSDPSKPFRVSLAWTDAPGSTVGNAFVNNLDLTVTVGGNTYRGNVFLGANSITGGSADPANNLESVFLPAGVSGNFSITVNATNIAGDGVPGDGDPTDQDFALVCYNCVETPVSVIDAAGATVTEENCLPFDGIVGPGETVTVDFNLQNIGTLNTTDLVATLQATGGVVNPSGSQHYGVVVAGGAPVAKSFTFTASASCGQTIVATFNLQDGSTNLGTVTFTFLTGTQGTAINYSYTGPNVAIPDNNPTGVNATVTVAGFPGPMSDVNISIDGVGPCNATAGSLNNGVTHTWIGDLVFKLTSPAGTTVTFINRAGPGTLGTSGNNICNTIFDDESGGPNFSTIQDTGVPPLGPPYTGTFTPQSSLAPFEGQDPNGTWTLNVSDNAAIDTGSLNRFTIRISPFNCCTNLCPTFTFGALADGTMNLLYDQTVSVGNGTAPYTFAVSSGSLPAGLTLNTSTGQITGTPTTLGTSNFEIKATDANGCTGKHSYTITIGCPLITVNPATLPDGQAGLVYSPSVSAGGGTGPYTFAITSGSLPNGLTLNPNGDITGIPTQLGPFNFDITATDSIGCTGVRSYSITMTCAPISVYPAILPDGIVGTAYDQTVFGVDGIGPYTFAITFGSLPDGLTLNPTTGQVSGTPTTAGVFRYDITATDSNGCSGLRGYIQTISCPAITVNPGILPGATVGTFYDQTVSATGGTSPHTFSVTAGTLPTGLTLDANTGQITGTPTAAGTFNFTITAADFYGCTGSTAYSVLVQCPVITVSPANLPNGTVGTSYDQTVSASGGTSPYTFAVTSGNLPTGLTLDSNTGQISGTPTAAGTFNFDITATDTYGCTGVTSYSITMNCPAITVNPATLPNGTIGASYDQTVSGSGGTAPYTFAVTSGNLPTGLTLDANTGQITGTPTALGTFNFDITATDTYGCSGTQSYSITINCPVITVDPATLPNGTVGTAYDQTVSGSGGASPYTFAVTNGSLPTGLTLDSSTGQISGTPTAAGTFNFDITATDANGCTGVTSYSVTMNCPTITLNPATLPNGTVGTLYDQTVSGSGGTAPYTFAVTSGSLPTGLTLDANTGQITGTPTAAGTFNFDITATDANGCSGVKSYSITMDCPLIALNPATLPDGIISVVYDQTVSGSGGTAPYTFAVTNGSLPTGLTLDANTGQITGTPTALGTFNFDITATDTYGCSGTKSYSITINCPVITVTPATLPNGTVGTLYDQTVSGSGGAAPSTFAVTTGSLPTGLTLDANTGQISGTPTAAGTFNFDITATDANGCTGVTSYSITMNCPAITVNPATLPNGTIGVLYDQTVSGSGGTAPYTFAVTNGSLPNGLTLDSNTGQITGTPTVLGTFNFDITATDTYGCSGTTSYSVTINCPVITVTPATLPNGTVGTLYDQTVSGNGGAVPYTFAVTNGTLPSGLTLNTSTGQISGTPTAAGTFNFDITATDANGCSGVQSYSITMTCPVITVLPATLPGGTTGVLYDQTVSGSGGTAPYTFAVTNGSLPNGLTLNSTTGQITGTPSVTGTFNFDITATDANGCAGVTSYSIAIGCPAISVLPATLPGGTTGVLYDQTVSGAGGTAPYTFNLSSGSLPNGLTLNSTTGQITGTPTVAGTFNFDITATDMFGCIGTTSYSVTISCAAITVNPATLPDGVQGTLYDQTVSGSGGTAPYTFAVTNGSLPTGLTLDSNTGQITGTPSVVGAFSFDITATDASGCTGVASYTVNINLPCLFCDEFDDSTVDGNWTYIKHMSDWTEDGTALIGHPVKKKTQAHAIPVFTGCTTCNAQTIMRTAGGAYNRVWFMFHLVDKDNLVELMMKEEDDKWVLKHRVNKKIVAKQKFLAPIDPNVDYAVSIRYDGTNYIVSINATDVITMAPGVAATGGSIGFKVKSTTGTFQRIQVN